MHFIQPKTADYYASLFTWVASVTVAATALAVIFSDHTPVLLNLAID